MSAAEGAAAAAMAEITKQAMEHRQQARPDPESNFKADRQSLTQVRPAFPVDSMRPEIFNSENSLPLPEKYMVTKYDVMNGRGRKSYNHIGNRRFRQMITLNLKRYYEAKIKTDKSMVVAGIVCAMREACPSGGFLKPDPKRKDKKVFITVGGRETREKVGHCLRDMIASIREDTRRNDQLKILEAPKIQARPLAKPNHQLPTKMSDQQIQILRRLERGFDGSVEDLLKGTAA